LHRSADGRYSLAADTSAFLVSSKPGYHGGIVSHLAKDLIPNWLSLSEIVRTGKPSAEVNQQEGGAEFFEHFVESLFPMGYPAGTALAGSLGVAESSQPIKVLDIAAGSGVWGIALAQASPNVTITAVDWPNVLGVTRRVAERLGLGDRLTGIPGDIQEVDLGSGYNIATLGHILHSEGEARSRRLLRRVFDALAPGGTIAIAEFMVNEERTGPPVSLIFASNMLVNTDDGDTFTLTEMTAWLAEAGFVDVRTLAAPGPSPLVLATRP